MAARGDPGRPDAAAVAAAVVAEGFERVGVSQRLEVRSRARLKGLARVERLVRASREVPGAKKDAKSAPWRVPRC